MLKIQKENKKLMEKHRHYSSSNSNFNASEINKIWVTDITYIHTLKDGCCYLASVMDLFTKKCWIFIF